MECECEDGHGRTNVRTHKVIRKFLIAGLYHQCGYCGRIEWLELSDALEMEITNANYECIKAKVEGKVAVNL